mgnify:CR=1 FL=1
MEAAAAPALAAEPTIEAAAPAEEVAAPAAPGTAEAPAAVAAEGTVEAAAAESTVEAAAGGTVEAAAAEAAAVPAAEAPAPTAAAPTNAAAPDAMIEETAALDTSAQVAAARVRVQAALEAARALMLSVPLPAEGVAAAPGVAGADGGAALAAAQLPVMAAEALEVVVRPMGVEAAGQVLDRIRSINQILEQVRGGGGGWGRGRHVPCWGSFGERRRSGSKGHTVWVWKRAAGLGVQVGRLRS